MKKYFSIIVAALLSKLMFCSCELTNKPNLKEDKMAKLFRLSYQMMGHSATELMETAEQLGLSVRPVYFTNDSVIEMCVVDSIVTCWFNNECVGQVTISNTFFDTSVNGGSRYMNLSDSIFAYGWDDWIGQTPEPWDEDWNFSDISLHPAYREALTPYFANVQDKKACKVQQLFQKSIGSQYLYVTYSYLADKADPLKEGETVPQRKISFYVCLNLQAVPSGIFDD